MNIRKGDNVKSIAGASRGKTGKVLSINRQTNRITVEGVNLRVKHTKPRRQGQAGQKVELPASMHISNVMLVCPKCGKTTRVGKSSQDHESKKRMCKECKQTID